MNHRLVSYGLVHTCTVNIDRALNLTFVLTAYHLFHVMLMPCRLAKIFHLPMTMWTAYCFSCYAILLCTGK